MSWTLEEVARAVGGQLSDAQRLSVDSVSTDTRTLRPGALFIAISGENYDGHDFLEEAVARGAVAALVSKNSLTPTQVPAIRVEDTVVALGSLAHDRRQAFSGPVIAITGSNGKTTTKEMCSAILGAAGLQVRRSPGNFNNHIGLPLSILGLEHGDEALVLELGMNHAGEIDALTRIAEPTVAAIIQIAPAHLGPLGSIEAIARAKGELFDHICPDGTAVVNADDPLVREQAVRFPGRRLSFGFAEEADFHVTIESESDAESVFSMRTPSGTCRVHLAVPGRHLIEDAVCAAALAWASGSLGDTPTRAIRQGLESFKSLPGRLCVLESPDGLRILDDSYNANPRSVNAALRVLARLASPGRGILVLGDMLELGPDAEQLHASVGQFAAEVGIHAVIGVGPLAAHAATAAGAAGVAVSVAVPDTQAAATEVQGLARSNDCVLVKGSRSTHMERVVSTLMAER
jgi:UDP-N-acetylmuramoyl-tripeptide--D-alanyl-D-alanine ligase